MSKHELKQLIRQKLRAYFDGLDFTFRAYAGERDTFTLYKQDGVTQLYLDYKSSGSHYFSKVCISIFDIERMIVELGLPNHDFSERLKKKDYSLTTIYDSQNLTTYNSKERPVQTAQDAESYSQSIIQYMEQYGLAFAQRYSYLPNVLAEMNRLEMEGKLWREIIDGQAEYFFRGLIISKLCNDSKHSQKLEYTDSVFLDAQYNLNDWLPYYELLKLKLKTLQPQQNL